MSKIAVSSNPSGTGTFTIQSPATNTDRVLTLPDEAGTVLINGTNNNVGIGTTSPGAKLGVGGGAGNAKIKLSNTASGSGSGDGFDLDFTGTDIYITNRENGFMAFENAGAERMRLDSSGNLKFNSGYGSVATAYGCRAWVNFRGNIATPTIRVSGNVSTIGDRGTGAYTVNFTTSLPGDYCAISDSDTWIANTSSLATGSYNIDIFDTNGSLTDSNIISSMVIR